MKNLYRSARLLGMMMWLLLFSTYTHAQSVSSDKTPEQEAAINHRMNELARVHRIVYLLPYSEEYIRETIMGEIKAHRKQVAPHFPERHEIPAGESAMVYIRNWAFNYPEEHTAYIAYVEKVARSYHKQK